LSKKLLSTVLEVIRDVDREGISFSKVVVAVGRSDLRLGLDGLAALVRLKYNLNPLEKDTLFLFCGTRSDRLKGILWSGDTGYVTSHIISGFIQAANSWTALRSSSSVMSRPAAQSICAASTGSSWATSPVMHTFLTRCWRRKAMGISKPLAV